MKNYFWLKHICCLQIRWRQQLQCAKIKDFEFAISGTDFSAVLKVYSTSTIWQYTYLVILIKKWIEFMAQADLLFFISMGTAAYIAPKLTWMIFLMVQMIIHCTKRKSTTFYPYILYSSSYTYTDKKQELCWPKSTLRYDLAEV